MDNSEFEKSKIFIITEMNDYVPNSVFMKSILKKTTGDVNAIFIDKGSKIVENLSRFDHLIQLIEGKATIQIEENVFNLTSGQSIIIPANSKTIIKADERIKMISTIIKSGYE